MKAWTHYWDFPAALVMLAASLAAFWRAPSVTRLSSASEALLWFGGVMLASGLLLDVWRLVVVKVKPGEKEQAMCLESMVGVLAVTAGLLLLARPQWSWPVPLSGVLAYLSGCLVASAWIHDMVIVNRQGRWRLMREPDHGSFIVFGLSKASKSQSE